MEVDNGTILDDAVDSQASQTSTTSGSSLAIQFSLDDLQENSAQLPQPQSPETIRKEGKARRLNRRLALANLQLPKLSVKEDCVIDLCTEEDKAEDLAWFKKKFPTIKTDKLESKINKEPSPSKNQQFPHSVATQRALKQDLEKKLAKRRKAEMAKRRELYMEDNEDLLLEEEEEEADTKKSIKPKKPIKKPLGSDDDSEEDEDYNGDDEEEEVDGSGSESDMSDASDADEDGVEDVKEESNENADKTTDDLPESVDLFDGATAGSMIKENHGHTDKEAAGPRLHPVEVGYNVFLSVSLY
ncbi:unnamed protein product [Strongylus vulgaris]|uniref:Uncharacterized protein n=1 Tax=Strongylus vulgaris TaxID=40348 RepID=A0A3P7LSS3_STRVU|nr:unnamed protein product [Strongylus vulgaris]